MEFFYYFASWGFWIQIRIHKLPSFFLVRLGALADIGHISQAESPIGCGFLVICSLHPFVGCGIIFFLISRIAIVHHGWVITVLSRQTEIACCLLSTFHHSLTLGKQLRGHVLRLGITLVGQRAQDYGRLFIVTIFYQILSPAYLKFLGKCGSSEHRHCQHY